MHTLDQLRSGHLQGITRLSLSAGLSEFPPEIYDLSDSLEILDLTGNRLSSLPDDLPRLKRLRILFASNNRFTALPEILGDCPNLSMVGFKANQIRNVSASALPAKLRWLTLTDNDIEALPETIGDCREMQKLMLAGNRLKALPESLAACEKLELLRIAANDLSEMPGWLFDLPRLSWLAYAGNPFAPEPDSDASLVAADWAELELKAVLGEGASGVIHRATLRGQDVAVKLFKGAVTSDGLPHSEMTACLNAGCHPNLIPVRGRVTGAPEGRDALVMELISAEFDVLAGPPSLSTCTRDVYAEGLSFTPEVARRVAKGIASAVTHLASRGINHGDIYAHNILHNGRGDALIGDFGAAAFVPPQHAEGLARMEVRALGCLFEELSALSGDKTLASLAAACLTETAANRPGFADIIATLA